MDWLMHNDVRSTRALFPYSGARLRLGLPVGFPWLGSLPESKRERWLDELEARGIDPESDSMPPEFRTDAWFRRDRNPPNQH